MIIDLFVMLLENFHVDIHGNGNGNGNANLPLTMFFSSYISIIAHYCFRSMEMKIKGG